MTDIRKELLPCPMCGSDKIQVRMPDDIGRFHYVGCHNCALQTTYYAKPDAAVKAWNIRSHNVDGMIAALEGQVEQHPLDAYDYGFNSGMRTAISVIRKHFGRE